MLQEETLKKRAHSTNIDDFTPTQKCSIILKTPTIHYHIQTRPKLVHIQNQINSACPFTILIFSYHIYMVYLRSSLCRFSHQNFDRISLLCMLHEISHVHLHGLMILILFSKSHKLLSPSPCIFLQPVSSVILDSNSFPSINFQTPCILLNDLPSGSRKHYLREGAL
jgi:hypothetical protein